MGNRVQFAEYVSSGNNCIFVGIDQHIVQTATVTSDPRSFSFQSFIFRENLQAT